MRFIPKYCAVTALVASAATGGQALAGAVQLTSSALLAAGDTTLVFPNAVGGTPVSSPASFSAGGNTLTFTSIRFELDKVGENYGDTGFADGTMILFAGGYSGAGGPVTLRFANAVSEFGLNIEDFNPGDYVVSFTAFNGATSLGTFTAAGNDPRALSFEGLRATGTDVITSVVFSDNYGVNANMGFGPIRFATANAGTAAVPEPVSSSLFGIGVVGLVMVRRRRRGAG